jgi:molecular chaperone GrpE
MNEHDRRPDDVDARARQEATGVEAEAETPLSEEAPRPDAEGADTIDAPQTELEILRGELASLQERVAAAEKALAQQEARALRARAEADTVRRLAASDQSRARDAGMDAVVLPVMTVWDDLRRALAAAESGDPASILPGVRAVMETLERELGKLEIERVGDPGEAFDPDLHEALTAVPLSDGAVPGTIAEVFEAGFKRGDRLIRPARVIVYQDDQG